VFTPIRKVNYAVETTRVGQRTDLERLVLEVWTDGTVTPVDAVRQAGDMLVNKFFLFASAQKSVKEGTEDGSVPLKIPAEHYNIPVERLELSSRTLNCLKRAGINRVGEVLEMTKPEILRIRNFGDKSYDELFGRLRDMDLVPPELDPDLVEAEPTDEAEPAAEAESEGEGQPAPEEETAS
jgi:DNA-directed RNA polymerase subunit alpha